MIDSGATALFIHHDYCKRKNISTVPLKKPIRLFNIDGTPNESGSITHSAELDLTVGESKSRETFLVTNVGPEDVILGLPWLKKENPQISWDTGDIHLQSDKEDAPPSPPKPQKLEANRAERRQWLKAGIIEDTSDEVWILMGYTYSQKIAETVNRNKYAKALDELVPKEYRHHKKVFSEEESYRLPEH